MERSTGPEWQGGEPPAAPAPAPASAARRPRLPASAELFAGALAAAVAALVLIEIRFDDDWADGVLLAAVAVPCVAVFALGLRGGRPAAEPAGQRSAAEPAGQRSALLIAGLVLLVVVLVRVVEMIVDDDSPETAVAIAAGVFVIVAAAIALAYRSAACALLAAVGAGVLTLAAVAAVGDPDDERPFLWAFLAYTAVMLGGGLLLRLLGERRHSTQLVNAASIAVVLFGWWFGLFFGVEDDSGSYGGGLEREWEGLLVGGSLAALLFGILFRERGPAWGGGLGLVLAIYSVSGESDETPTLVGWPLFLIAAAVGLAVAAALRARTDHR